jgi:hypothetical protein
MWALRHGWKHFHFKGRGSPQNSFGCARENTKPEGFLEDSHTCFKAVIRVIAPPQPERAALGCCRFAVKR